MAKKIDEQIAAVVGKDALHRWVDSLPDDTRGVILVEYADAEGVNWQQSRGIGTNSSAEIIWLMRSYEHRLICGNDA